MAGVLARSESAPYLTRRPVLTERMARRRLRRMVASLTRGEPTRMESLLYDVWAEDIASELQNAGGYYFETDDDGMLYIAYDDGAEADPDDPSLPFLGIQLPSDLIPVVARYEESRYGASRHDSATWL